MLFFRVPDLEVAMNTAPHESGTTVDRESVGKVSRRQAAPRRTSETASWESRDMALWLLPYKFALDEMLTKINILREELTVRGQGNPIEHVSSRMKPLDSIRSKAERLGLSTPAEAFAELSDIAGIRVVCSFVSDIYRVMEMIKRHGDLRIVQVKDYVAAPKANGYRSLHLIVEIPVFLSEGTHQVRVEVQIRTVAMDFWASVEHKIYYKYATEIPDELRDELLRAATSSHDLDLRMQRLHRVVHGGLQAGVPSAVQGDLEQTFPGNGTT